LIYFDYFLVRHLRVIIIIRKTYPVDILLPRKGPPSLDYHYNNKMAMKPLGGGDFEMATPPATTTNHLLGGRNLCLVLL
jgi:hypothetical protein